MNLSIQFCLKKIKHFQWQAERDADTLHGRLQQLLEPTQGVLQRESKFLCVRLLAAVEGGDGKVDVVGLRVVANGVAVRNEGAKTHHAVRVGRNLMRQNNSSLV